jgi:hypothetical protein
VRYIYECLSYSDTGTKAISPWEPIVRSANPSILGSVIRSSTIDVSKAGIDCRSCQERIFESESMEATR